MQNTAKDLLTQEVFIKRRNNQLFATRKNQVLYNNLKARKKKIATGAISRILDKNRSVLLRILCDKNEIQKISKDWLLGAGYNFSYVTHSKRISSESNQIANYVFEIGLLKLDETHYKIFKNNG